jgi:hypothetical protein
MQINIGILEDDLQNTNMFAAVQALTAVVMKSSNP